MARRLYNIVFYLALPLVFLRLCYRASRSGAYARRIAERFGYFTQPDFVGASGFNGAIWVHAVSVGETIAAAALIKRLQQQFPHTPVVVTTMTPTGSERVKALFNDSVFHVYAPYDLPGSVNRFLHRVQPKLLVIMETELWPNILYYCDQKKIPIVLANARLSAKSAKGYRRLSALSQPMLQHVSMIAAQNQSDADRFIQLGVASQRLQVTGSIKFDISLDQSVQKKAAQLKMQWSANGERLLFVAASTHDGEDELILQAFQQLLIDYPKTLLLLVPRHPERFNTVTMLCQREGLQTQRRSQIDTPKADTQVVVGDTMGELLLLYGVADIAFVGGSLVQRGGHNMLEPAAWGLPIVIGESDFNFAEISALLQSAGAVQKAGNVQALAAYLIRLAKDVSLRQSAGQAALSVVMSNRGALDRLLVLLDKYLTDR